MERCVPEARALKVGVLGGTFDPVHNAHLAMAHAALRGLALGRIVFIPTGEPRYRTRAVASGTHRVTMLELALAGEPRCKVDARELAPQSSGYTVDTLRELRAEAPRNDLVLLIGGDQYAKLHEWREPEEIARLAGIAVFARPGFPTPKPPAIAVAFDPMPISASEVRARAARGEDVSDVVPAAVANYITRHHLYR